MTNYNEFPYDWNYGKAVYITFLSAIFGGTIILEGKKTHVRCFWAENWFLAYFPFSQNCTSTCSLGVTTSIMAQVTPSELNSHFLNVGLLATLIGTIGRVLSDSMITVTALLDLHVFIDFVNATFLPLLLLALCCLGLVYRYYDKLVN